MSTESDGDTQSSGSGAGTDWLRLFPNQGSWITLPSIEADAITRSDFIQRYVNHCQPVVIRGAMKRCTAYHKWTLDYLEQLVVARYPRIAGAFKEPIAEAVVKQSDRVNLLKQHSVESRELFRQLRRQTNESISVYSLFFARDGSGKHTLGLDTLTYHIPELEQDLEEGKLFDIRLAPNSYPSRRLFLHKNSYTDWHIHDDDETLTTEFLGRKEMLLLPPSDEAWQIMLPFATAGGFAQPKEKPRLDLLARLRPFHVVLEPGDTIYIPVYWWHAAAGRGTGATIAECFASPPEVAGNLCYPAARGRALRDTAGGNTMQMLERVTAWLLADRILEGRFQAEWAEANQ